MSNKTLKKVQKRIEKLKRRAEAEAEIKKHKSHFTHAEVRIRAKNHVDISDKE